MSRPTLSLKKRALEADRAQAAILKALADPPSAGLFGLGQAGEQEPERTSE